MSPFPVDADVLARIRPLTPQDAPAVARLHHAAMGRSLWARLGTPFLEALYRGLAASPRFLGFVYVEDDRVRGFIAGSTDTSRLYRETLRRHWRRLLMPALLGVLRDPRVLVPLLTTPRYFSASASTVRAESMFCSFEPDLRGRRVSGHINKVLFDELLGRGHRTVKITTEADNHAAVRQLESWGFERVHDFGFYGKKMVTWLLDLKASDRVDPCRRHPSPEEDTGPR